ncbi:hypothetical protein BAXH7_04123 [Bacillus amyloliquefaciens XH7]|nr:hypothetical protein BAXH7_04123 [Bacillus amyloliquefaciens XH7]
MLYVNTIFTLFENVLLKTNLQIQKNRYNKRYGTDIDS